MYTNNHHSDFNPATIDMKAIANPCKSRLGYGSLACIAAGSLSLVVDGDANKSETWEFYTCLFIAPKKECCFQTFIQIR